VTTAAVESQSRAGRPDRAESRRRGKRFVELVVQEGCAPDIAAEKAGVDPRRALRVLGDLQDVGVWPREVAR
jgi:hypothetical protein